MSARPFIIGLCVIVVGFIPTVGLLSSFSFFLFRLFLFTFSL